jgi:hypothetical protein
MTAGSLPVLGLLAVGCLPAAQNPAPPASSTPTDAELREILKKSADEDTLNFDPSRDYVYVEDKETRLVDAQGKVTKSHSETRESMVLYGERYERLIRKDGKPLSPKQERAEQQKLDKETSKRKREPAEAKAKRLETERQRNLACSGEFVDGFQFRLLGVESVNGRPAWKVEAEPIPGGSPGCEAVKKVKQFRLRIWIDQAEPSWSRMEADNVAPVTAGAILIRAPAGALHTIVESTRRDDGAWLPARTLIRVDAKLILMAKVHLEIETTYSDYRKFQSESKIVE